MSLTASSPRNIRTFVRVLAISALVAVAAIQVFSLAGDQSWSAYGGNASSSRYFDSKQINKGNVAQLEAVWTYPYGEAVFHPLIVRNTIYARGRGGALIALDAKTGKELWIHE